MHNAQIRSNAVLTKGKVYNARFLHRPESELLHHRAVYTVST